MSRGVKAEDEMKVFGVVVASLFQRGERRMAVRASRKSDGEKLFIEIRLNELTEEEYETYGE